MRRSSTGSRTRSRRRREMWRFGYCAEIQVGGAWGLCRNGMWITEELPMFQNAFADRQPFQALILLSSDSEDTFFELIQEAETPLHDKLAPKQMDPDRRKALREALRELRDRIAELVPVVGRRTSTAPRTSWPSSSRMSTGRGEAVASRPFGAGWEPRDGRQW